MPKIRIKEPNSDTKSFSIKIDREIVNIGRHGDCMIQLEDDSISTEHVVIKRVPGGFILYDQDSTNGTKIEGKKYSIVDLNKTRHLTLGEVQVSFILSEADLTELAKENFTSEEKAIIGIKKGEDPSDQNDEIDLTEGENDDAEWQNEEEDDEENSSALSGFVATLIAFIITIIILVVGLMLTGHLKF